MADPGAVSTDGQLESVVKQETADAVCDEPVTEFAAESPEDCHTYYKTAVHSKMGNDQHDRCEPAARCISELLQEKQVL